VQTQNGVTGQSGDVGYGVAGANSKPPTPTPFLCATPTPTHTPTNCGLNITPQDIGPFTVNDPNGLSTDSAAGQQSFNDQVKALFDPYKNKKAGLVEIFGGGGGDVGTGIRFATHAQTAMQLLAQQKFIFDTTKTLFQPLADISLNTDQIEMKVFFYDLAADGKCAASGTL
jgi:hypothetical protein